MKKIFLLIGMIVFCTGISFAQKENNVWIYGDHTGLNFNSGSPVYVSSNIATTGGSASICDANGQLLFYTQGDTVWNRNNIVMPNGGGMIAPYSSNAGSQSSQGQLIVPVVNDPARYYVFSMQATADYLWGGDPYGSRLYYSIVDMTLNNGLGGIVAGQRKIALDSVLTGEKMIAIPGDSCSIWLLVHSVENNNFKAYKINNTGLHTTPVVSACGTMTTPLSYALGKMKISPNGKKLVTANWLFGNFGCELYDFNTATGVVSNPVVLDSTGQGISACFSPDNSKLYYFSFAGGNGAMYQYNLSLSTTPAIVASRTLIDTLTAAGASVYDAKRGPDGKVYVKMPYSATGPNPHDTVGCIAAPNVAGTACNYTRAALVSPNPIMLGNGDLPNECVKPKQDTFHISSNTNLTLNGNLVLNAPGGYFSHKWDNGDTTASRTVTAVGTYWVTSTNYCGQSIDTFHVSPPLGVESVTLQTGNLKVYPNPANNEITVAINSQGNPSGMLQITDMLGKTIITTTVEKNITHLNVAELASGVYHVTYIDNQQPTNRWHTSLVIGK